MTMMRSTKAGHLILTVFVGAALLLAGCAGGAAAPSATPTPSATATAAPTSTTPSASPTSAVPRASPRAAMPSVRQPRAPTRSRPCGCSPTGRASSGPCRTTRPSRSAGTGSRATRRESCSSSARPRLTTSPQPVAGLPAKGFSCQTSDDFGAAYCTMPGTGAKLGRHRRCSRQRVDLHGEPQRQRPRAPLDLASQVFH